MLKREPPRSRWLASRSFLASSALTFSTSMRRLSRSRLSRRSLSSRWRSRFLRASGSAGTIFSRSFSRELFSMSGMLTDVLVSSLKVPKPPPLS